MKTLAFIEALERCSAEQLLEKQQSIRNDLIHVLNCKEEIDTQARMLQDQLEVINRVIRKEIVPIVSWKDNVTVTDHAIVRYMERILKFDIIGLRRRIKESLPDRLVKDSKIIATPKVAYRLIHDGGRTVISTVVKNKRVPK